MSLPRTKLPPKDHNQPPDPILELWAKHSDTIDEVENWLDGDEVENEGQMKAVDSLIKDIKAIENEAKAGKDSEYRPHKDGCDRVIARWKPPLKELETFRTGLLAIVGPFKQALADEKEAAKRKAYDEARKADEAARKAAEAVDMKNIEERRKADRLAEKASDASKAAQVARDDKVKGLRKTYIPEIVDAKACINWIATNDRAAVMEFITAYVARKTREGVRDIAGVVVTETKRAF